MRNNFLALVFGLIPCLTFGQSAVDAYNLSQNDLRGTARSMSMAGAFGALGGDLSTLNQNPAGIGVYRSSDLGATIEFNGQSSETTDWGRKFGDYNNFVFSLNNAGYVGAYKLNSEVMKNINWGFTYNRLVSFNRRTRGGIGNLQSSLTNYVAGTTSGGDLTPDVLGQTDTYDPYYDSNAPWLSTLAYNSYMINPINEFGDYQGLLGDGTSGAAEFETIETGGVDEYTFNLGGNLSNLLYWGVCFGVTDLNYKSYTYYGEALNNAYVSDLDGNITVGDASWGLENRLTTHGTGYNFKMGLIFKPINEFRLGFAFHTPTYYSLKDEYFANTSFAYGNGLSGDARTNSGYIGETWYEIKTPWKFMASAAAVLGRKAILSFDYEYIGYQTMRVASDSGYEYWDVTNDIQNYYKESNIFRVGLEYRLTDNFSVRGGFSHQTSPVNEDAMNDRVDIITSGTTPSYLFLKQTQYITCGLGYRHGPVYVDLAYVHKDKESEFHAFSPVVYDGGIEPSPKTTVNEYNNRVVLTLGFRF